MSVPRLKSLESCARATGSAFGFEDVPARAFAHETRHWRLGAFVLLALGAGALMALLRLGWAIA